jgi:hypothetical protein
MATTGTDVFAQLRETYTMRAKRAVRYLDEHLFEARRALEAGTIPAQARWVPAALDLTVSVQALEVLGEIERREEPV